jgi:hypothetical protein
VSSRARKYVALVVTALAAAGLTTVANAGEWSKGELYGVGAGLLVVIVFVVNLWIEMAPDGAFRREPRR